ncbi:hypothetical protein [Lysobacter gummosus]|uniref:hypothetical protein n=1 Tax=Lysobacter gummosus TaxID=262324 RepID=UPI003636338E
MPSNASRAPGSTSATGTARPCSAWPGSSIATPRKARWNCANSSTAAASTGSSRRPPARPTARRTHRPRPRTAASTTTARPWPRPWRASSARPAPPPASTSTVPKPATPTGAAPSPALSTNDHVGGITMESPEPYRRRDRGSQQRCDASTIETRRTRQASRRTAPPSQRSPRSPRSSLPFEKGVKGIRFTPPRTTGPQRRSQRPG